MKTKITFEDYLKKENLTENTIDSYLVSGKLFSIVFGK